MPASTSYPLGDLLYRSSALTDDAGEIEEAYDADAYGNTLIYDAPGPDGEWFTDDDVQGLLPACDYIFTGREYDPESQIYYYRARYYHPMLGRFIGRDPIDYQGGLNPYEYVEGCSPIRLDATGLQTTKPCKPPSAMIISLIASIDTASINEPDLILRYERSTGKTLTAGRALGLNTAITFLADSTNADPPNSFTTASFSAFKAQKDYRGFALLQPSITCTNGVVTSATPNVTTSNGFTPERLNGMLIHHGPGEGHTYLTVGHTGSNCIKIVVKHIFRVDQLGQLFSRIFIGVGVPWAWHRIDTSTAARTIKRIFILAEAIFPLILHIRTLRRSEVEINPDSQILFFAGSGNLAPGGSI